ncbi:MAG: hypothetical protein ACRCT2_10340, partial [Plesiomonas shigelloides]
MAKRHLQQLYHSGTPVDKQAPLLGEGFRCLLGAHKLTSDIHAPILIHVFTPDIRTYLAGRELLTPQAFDSIYWKGLQEGLSQTSSAIRIWYSKFASGHISVGRMMKRWGFQTSDHCPCCGSENETTSHLLQCPDQRMRDTFTTGIQELENTLTRLTTEPTLQQWLLHFLRQLAPPLERSDDPLARLAIEAQTDINWQNTLLGRLASHWVTLQHCYL